VAVSMDDFDAKETVAVIASTCQIVQFLSGILVCRKFMKKGSVGDTSSFPFISGFLSSVLWCRYGKLIDDSAIILVNSAGAILMMMYILVYFNYTTRKNFLVKQLLCVIFCILGVFFYLHTSNDLELAKEHLGYICCTVTFVFFGAPLLNLSHVIKTKSAESLPFPLILMSALVSFLWMLYGLLLQNSFVVVPNLGGFVLASFQLSLFVIYSSL